MLNVTGSHSHLGNPALGEVCHRLVDVFLWQLFPDGLQGDFQLVSLGVYFTLPSWRTSSSPAGTNLDSGEFQWTLGEFACSQFCMTLETLTNWGLSSLKEHNFVIFRYILTILLQ